MLYYLVATIYVLVCFLLLIVVLLQQGKGGDMASAFGGGGSQTAFGEATAARVVVQYGGSVKADNAGELLASPDIDGALVGGASLDPHGFAKIVTNFQAARG